MRTALLPADVLTGDAAQQWLAAAIPIVLQQDLATSASIAASFVPNASVGYQNESDQIVRTTVEQHGERWRIQLILTATSTQENRHVFEAEGPVNGGLIPLLDALAKKLDPNRAGPFSTRSEQAWKLLTAAVTSPDAAARSQLLALAVQNDPQFGLAEIALVENSPPSSETPALSAGDHFVPLDRARWRALYERRQQASIERRAAADQAVVNLAPNNVEALSNLGLESFYSGHSDEGERLFRHAIAINPANSALPVQLTQGLVAARKFSEAEKVLGPLADANPTLLPPLALLQLLANQSDLAEKTFRRFVSFLPPGSPAVVPLEKQWQRFTKPDANEAPLETPQFWHDAVEKSGGMNLAARALYAAALNHAGNIQAARDVSLLPFIPEFADSNAPVGFNEMRLRLAGHT